MDIYINYALRCDRNLTGTPPYTQFSFKELEPSTKELAPITQPFGIQEPDRIVELYQSRHHYR